MAETPDPQAINRLDPIPDECRYVGNLPFGHLKATNGLLNDNYGGRPIIMSTADRKETVKQQHSADGIDFCDRPEDNFMVKHSPLRAKIQTSGFGVRYQWTMYGHEVFGAFIANCNQSSGVADLIVPKEVIDNADPQAVFWLPQEDVQPPAGWLYAYEPWGLNVTTGLANIGPWDGTAYQIFGEWAIKIFYFWFNGINLIPYQQAPRPFISWIMRTNTSGSCDIYEYREPEWGGLGMPRIGSGRCLGVTMAGSVVHCSNYVGPECIQPAFPVACLRKTPFQPFDHDLNYSPFMLHFDLKFLGFTLNGELLPWDHPRSGIPPEIWFPEG